MSNLSRLAILADFKEEGWPSMDLVAEMLADQTAGFDGAAIVGTLLQPQYRKLFGRLPGLRRHPAVNNLDRFYNRFAIYPLFARQLSADFDFFHVADHSYGGLLHYLPTKRSGVYCHDLDAFKCLIEPEAESRPLWFRKMARHILSGMQKAAIVFHNSMTVRRSLLNYGLVEASKLVHAPLGVATEFTGAASSSGISTRIDAALISGFPSIVHVGSCIPRKRIDVLLETFALIRQTNPSLKLIKVGGTLTAEHQLQIKRLGIESSIQHLEGLSRKELAEVYRAATVVLVPSEAEGFGLPVIEALACGAPVIASDIPVLREVGGDVVGYAPVGAIEQWASLTSRLLDNQDAIASRERRLAHAAQYTWSRHAEIIAQAYLQLA